MQKKEYSTEIGGKTLTAIFTDLAEQAHGSVILKYGETIVHATACMSKDKQAGLGIFHFNFLFLYFGCLFLLAQSPTLLRYSGAQMLQSY